ncbi:MAG: MazG nucleotide pyrophosphohydrolase domain-containing protein [Legionellaceae bacterium]|nr:MazG nucleotide pyrophosphohydrolase domain-containing protein [Legionellaceae bacterium]
MELLERVLAAELDADKFGFRWENTSQIMAQIQSECEEVNEHLENASQQITQSELQEEIGDLLHAVFSLCVYCKFNPKDTLRKTVEKFERRMNAVKAIANEQGLHQLDGLAFDELMVFWDKAKEQVG